MAASLGELLTNRATNPNEDYRRSSQQALRDLEQWLLHNGLPALIGLRNRFARQMGYRNYFDYKVNKTERMTPEQLFAILDRFEQETREANARSLQQLAADKGSRALEPWNVRFASAGDVTRQLDPYFPFSRSLERWVDSFKRLHIGFGGAEMNLDLLVRKGKYENGFMHGPVPPFVRRGMGAGAHQLHQLAQPGQWAAALTGSTPCSTKAATRRISPTFARMRRASRRSSRRLQWPMPKPSRCSATACWTTPTG